MNQHLWIVVLFIMAVLALVLSITLSDISQGNTLPTCLDCNTCTVGLRVCGVGISVTGTLPVLNNITTSEIIGSTISITGGNTITTKGEMHFEESTGTNYVGFKAPSSVVTALAWTLPPMDGAAGEFLQTNGSGTLAWAAGGLGGNNFPDNLFNIFDNLNPASRIFFQADAISGVDRTFFAPDFDGILPATVVADNNLMIGESKYPTLGPQLTGVNNTFVGIGTGNVTTTGFSNVAVGANTLAANLTGGNNTALGASALRENTFGSNNVAIGNSAMLNINPVFNSVAVGVSAMENATSDGVAIGYRALRANAGSDNTAIGIESLRFNSSGGSNTAIGLNALRLNDSGSQNTAIGANSLSANTTGSDNMAIGLFALSGNTVGNENAAVGTLALSTNTASQNNAFGVRCLINNTIGSPNNAFGYNALESNTTGSNNVGIGHLVLQANTTGSRNIGIGTQALAGITAADTDNIGIGHTAMLALSDGSQNVGIGSLALCATGGATVFLRNVAVGHSAMTGTGSNSNDNVAIGANSLVATATNITFNTAVGSGALQFSTASNNTAIGYSSGTTIITGINNCLVGDSANVTAAATTGAVAVGHNTSSDTNGIALGNSATVTGTNGIAIGSSATAPANKIVIGNASHTRFNIPFAALPPFANNAAAVGAGLVPGDLYTVTGSDPRVVAITF